MGFMQNYCERFYDSETHMQLNLILNISVDDGVVLIVLMSVP